MLVKHRPGIDKLVKVNWPEPVAFIYLALISTAVLGDILYWTVSKFFAGYAKFFFYPVIFIIIIDLVKNKRIIKESFIFLMSACAGLSLIIGLQNNSIGKEFFAHFSPFILAIFAYSYGYRSELAGGKFISLIDKHAIHAGYLLSILVVFYYALVKYGVVEYFGAGALFAYPIFYCIAQKKYYHALLFFAANILTGKRSVVISISVVILIYLLRKLSFTGKVLVLTTIALAAATVVWVAGENDGDIGGAFQRYFIIFKYLAENDDVLKAVDLTTSGRLYDVIAVIETLGSSWINWLFGMGFGATFTIDYSFAEESHVTHYSHVTPFSYLLVGGFLLLTVAYGKLLIEMRRALVRDYDHLSMMVIYFFVIGFSGAIFFTDPFVWLLIGAFAARPLRRSIILARA
jgi:hypothetical protein